MRKLWALLAINFRSLLYALSFGATRRKKISGIATLALIGVFCLFLAGYYCFIGSMALNSIGATGYLFPLAAALACFTSFFFTLFCASGVIFGGRGMDLQLSLPVHSFWIMLTKMLALYLENLMFAGLFLLPAAGMQAYWQGRADIWYWAVIVLSIFLITFLPTFFSTLFGYCVAYLSGHIRHKALVTNLLYLGLFTAVFVGIFLLQNKLNQWVLTEQNLAKILGSWLYPFGMIQNALAGNWISLVELAAICLLPFGVCIYFCGKSYRKILSALSARESQEDYKLHQVKASSIFHALVKKEFRRYFGCPVYVANTLIGVIILVISGIATLIFQADIKIMLAQTEMENEVMSLLLAAAIFILSITCTTNVSISMEGKNLWILKEAPLRAECIFKAKIALQLLVVWPAIIIAGIFSALGFQLTVFEALLLCVTCFTYSLMNALCGLMINLLLPKMDCENDTVIVKQSASVMVSTLGGMFIALGMGAAIWLTQAWMPFTVQAWGLTIIFLLVSIACSRWLHCKGEKRLNQL